MYTDLKTWESLSKASIVIEELKHILDSTVRGDMSWSFLSNGLGKIATVQSPEITLISTAQYFLMPCYATIVKNSGFNFSYKIESRIVNQALRTFSCI